MREGGDALGEDGEESIFFEASRIRLTAINRQAPDSRAPGTVSQGRLQTSARTDERPRHDHDLFLALSVRRDHALSFAAGS